MNVTTSTLSSSSSADKVQRKVVFATIEHPITNKAATLREKLQEKINSMPVLDAKAYQAQKEQKKMRAEDRDIVENEEKKAKKAKVEGENEACYVPITQKVKATSEKIREKIRKMMPQKAAKAYQAQKVKKESENIMIVDVDFF